MAQYSLIWEVQLSTLFSFEDTFQDPQQIPEATDHVKLYVFPIHTYDNAYFIN